MYTDAGVIAVSGGFKCRPHRKNVVSLFLVRERDVLEMEHKI